ncbi:MAG TPA: DUF2243 domain-containing protein [Flavobacterium sp.]|jgi:uncharacterized membrane protein
MAIITTGFDAIMACTTCNRQLQDRIYDSAFYPNLLAMLSAFIVLAAVVGILSWLSLRRHRAAVRLYPGVIVLNPVPLATAAIVIGIGIGGFADGIVLHQLLQWHQMLSFQMPPDTLLDSKVNMFWDGLFHLFTLLVTIIGILLLWKLHGKTTISNSGSLLGGGIIMGWGLFNFIEGGINHHLLRLHNIRENAADPELWNYGFLFFSALLLAIGYFLIQKAKVVILETTIPD